MTLENLVEMMSPTYFEIVALFHKRLLNSFLTQIFLQLDVLEKVHKVWCGKDCELSKFWICCWDSSMSSILFFKSNFSSVGGTEKGVYESKSRMNIVKIVDKMVENLTRGRWILMNYVKSGSHFENYSHMIRDMGHIESDNPNPVYIVGSCCT